MSSLQKIGIDLMGGDVQPEVIIDAAVDVASHHPHIHFTLFSTQKYSATDTHSFSYEIVSQVISMEDHPLKAVRKKTNSSLVKGIEALKEKRLDAFISCGNTGALIAASSIHLPHLQGITRSALLAQFPSRNGPMAVLDVGASVTVKAERLIEFARLGAAFFCSRFQKPCARVALLNIGVESEKGTKEHQTAYHLLQALSDPSITFLGNIEPRDVFTSNIDVLVTPGFAGNIFLKTAEGVASFIFQLAEEAMNNGHGLDPLKAALSYEAASGALVAGLDALVIKCHGNSSKRAIKQAIIGASQMIDLKLIDKMKTLITHGV